MKLTFCTDNGDVSIPIRWAVYQKLIEFWTPFETDRYEKNPLCAYYDSLVAGEAFYGCGKCPWACALNDCGMPSEGIATMALNRIRAGKGRADDGRVVKNFRDRLKAAAQRGQKPTKKSTS